MQSLSQVSALVRIPVRTCSLFLTYVTDRSLYLDIAIEPYQGVLCDINPKQLL